ncbi:kinase domain protein (macronuclear) [Tetrahymena thermophila SB210]|uniref:Kinase domain protein n=1 Tax=Tetrahymena thermophila (strain SB210) TaxID=312017 RepID=Q22A05_TETTS|nr:kinase domain protein [Tetrahymena thermophila SB210]EAR82137.2 kinase domain protein [Tetrahymena thermophila SB210]|eukprot:XP_001029800.2 kinase domain protein [Tetrahymena thermophila SB210]
MSQILQDNTYELKYGSDLLQQVQFLNVIGQGNSVVYEVYHQVQNKNMALKEIILQSQEDEQYIKDEQQMLKFLSVEQQNSYFIKYEDFCFVKVIVNEYIEHNVAYLLMEKASISLSSFVDLRIKKNIPFSIEEIVFISEECINAFTCLQEYKIAHSDIKPENILLDFFPQEQNFQNSLNHIGEKLSEGTIIDQKFQNTKNTYVNQNINDKKYQKVDLNQQLAQKNQISNQSIQQKSIAIIDDSNKELSPNITLSSFTCRIKICDIGSAIKNNSSGEGNSVQLHRIEGTIPFLAPELFKKYIKKEVTALYNPYKSDVFSLGLCILFLIIQQRFYKQNRIYMEDTAYSEIIQEWIMYAKQITHFNSLISDVLDNTLQIQYENRPDFLQLNKLFQEKMKEENARRKRLRDRINLNSFQNMDLNEIESFSPNKLRSERISKNKSPQKNQSIHVNGIGNKSSSTQYENFKKAELSQNSKKTTATATTKYSIDYINSTIDTDIKSRQQITPNYRQQQVSVKEADLSISIFEQTGEINQVNAKIQIISTKRGKSAKRAKSTLSKQQDKKPQVQKQFLEQQQPILQMQNTKQKTLASENNKPSLLNKIDLQRKSSITANTIDFNIQPSQDSHDQVKQGKLIKLPSINKQSSNSGFNQTNLPQINNQSKNSISAANSLNKAEINLLPPRKKTQEFDQKNNIILIQNSDQIKQQNNANNNTKKSEYSKSDQNKDPIKNNNYKQLVVDTNKDQFKKTSLISSNLNNMQIPQKSFQISQTAGMEKIKQQLIQKQNQRIKTENSIISTNKAEQNIEQVQLIVISSIEQMRNEYEEINNLPLNLKAKKYLKIILSDIPSSIQILRLLKCINEIKNIEFVLNFSLESVRGDAESPCLFKNQSSSPTTKIDQPQLQNKQLSVQSNVQIPNQQPNELNSFNKLNFLKTYSNIEKVDKDQATANLKNKFNLSNFNFNNNNNKQSTIQQRSQSRSNRSIIIQQRKMNTSKNKSFSNDNLDSSFSSSQGNHSNKQNPNDLSVSIIEEQLWKASEVYKLLIEVLIQFKQLDQLTILFKNFIDQGDEKYFIENLQKISMDQQFTIKHIHIGINHLDKEITYFFEYVKLIIQKSQRVLETLSLNLKGQLANQNIKLRNTPLIQFIQNLKSYSLLKSIKLNLAKNKLKREFVIEFFETTKQFENLKELTINFGFNQICFPQFQILSINQRLNTLYLNFENNQLQDGIPSLAKQLPNCTQMKQLTLNFRQNISTSNDHIIFLLSCLKNMQIVTFNLNISDNSEINDQLFWKIQNLDDLSSWICSDLQFNIKNVHVGMPSIVSILEYLKKHTRSFHSITCTVLRRYSLEQVKDLISSYDFLNHYNLNIMKISQSHFQFILSLKQFSDFSNSSSKSLLKQKIQTIPDVLCEFFQQNHGQKKMYRCLTCENDSQLKDYVQYDTSIWKYCKQCIYVCHRSHEFIELASCFEEKEQCVCSFSNNSKCLLQNVKYKCTSQLGKNIFQQAFKCYDCSQNNSETYICQCCIEPCHKDHFVQFHSIRFFDCQCGKKH